MSRFNTCLSIVLLLLMSFQTIWEPGVLYSVGNTNPIEQRYFDLQSLDYHGTEAPDTAFLGSVNYRPLGAAHFTANSCWDSSDDVPAIDHTLKAATVFAASRVTQHPSRYVSALGRAPYKPQWIRLA